MEWVPRLAYARKERLAKGTEGIPEDEIEKLRRDAAALESEPLSELWPDCKPPEPTPKQRAIIDAIKGLSRAERLIIFLRYFEEMNFDEIAETLDLQPGWIRSAHQAILSRIKCKLPDGTLEDD